VNQWDGFSTSAESKDKSIRNEVKRGMGSFLRGGKQEIPMEIFNKVTELTVSTEK
jgi:hypothetical protein